MMTKSLARLRAKTDQELAILVRKELQRARTLAHGGEYQQAAHSYTLAANLLKVTLPSVVERLEPLRAEVRNLIELPLGATA